MRSFSPGENHCDRGLGLAFVLAITLFIAAAFSLGANPALADQASPETPAANEQAAGADGSENVADTSAASPGNVAALTSDVNDGIATQGIIGEADPVEVFFLVLVNREWKYLDANGDIYDAPTAEGYKPNDTTHQDSAWAGGSGRWFVSGDKLEKVYARFGFTTDALIKSTYNGEGQALFPHVEESGVGTGTPRPTIWANVRPWYDGSDVWAGGFSDASKWRIPGMTLASQNKGKRIFYYYLPNNTDVYNRNPQQYPEYFSGEADPNNAAIVKANSFYTVEVEDRDHIVYGADEEAPETSYAAARSEFSCTVKAPGVDATWNVFVDGALIPADSGRYTISYSGNDTVTITFPYDYASESGGSPALGVNGQVVISPTKTDSGSYDITYIAPMTRDQLQDVGDYKAGSQHFDESNNATVSGKAQVIEEYEGEQGSVYTVLSPDADQVYSTDEGAFNANGRKFLYDFQGWQVSGSTTLLQPGQTLTVDDLARLAPSGVLTLTAQWRCVLDNGYSTTCNFFVNTSCEVEDNLQNGYTSHAEDTYTSSVYATSVYGAEGFPAEAGGSAKTFQLTETDTQMNCYALDSQLRNSTTTPVPVEYDYTGVDSDHPNRKPVPLDYEGNGISVKRMPSDEEALAGVRAWVNASAGNEVTIDGESIPADQITSANFTVRWYVLKNQKADGWHIDGILVAKKAQMVVTKTFEGDSEAIQALTGYNATSFDASSPTDFYIKVTHSETIDGAATEVTDYQLLTVPDSEVKRTGTSDRRFGYSTYDETTHNYYWEVNTRQGREYAVQEMNSVYEGSGQDDVSWNNSRWVNVRNSGDADTNGWAEYDKSTAVNVRLRAAALPADLPLSSRQTVSFRNLYVHSGTLVVRKTDYTTGDPMPGVKFQISSAQDGSYGDMVLYRKVDTNEYTTDTAAGGDAEYEKVADAKAETDANGTFYLTLGVRTSESVKTGTYTLVEDYDTAPGYTGARSVTVTVTDDKGIDGNIAVDGDDSGVSWAHKGMNDFSLEIVNRSQELTTLAAKKHWESTSGEAVDEASAKPVKVQLWRRYGPEGSERVEEVPDGTFTIDGVEVPRLVDEYGNEASNTVELSASNNWCYRWGALPLFIDNYEVTYFLRETWIGDTSYDASADSDSGYASYKVTYDAARFTNADVAPDVTSDTEYKSGFGQTSCYWTSEAGDIVFANHELLAVNNAEKHGQITFTKKDREGGTGMPLSGATFELFYDEDCTRPVSGGVATSSEGGVVSFPKVPAGTYYFRETQAPAGYTFAENAVYKAVVTSGDPVITLVGDSSQTHLTTVTNKFGAALKIHKVGGGDQPLAGAEFSIAKQGGTGEWAQARIGVTDEDGNLWVTGVSQGTYTVTETKAANGYETPEDATFSFTVDTEGAVITAAPGELGDVFYDWNQVSDSSAETGGNGIVYQLGVRNTALFSLPTTGGVGIGATTAAGTALMCAAAYLWMRRRDAAAAGPQPKGGRHA